MIDIIKELRRIAAIGGYDAHDIIAEVEALATRLGQEAKPDAAAQERERCALIVSGNYGWVNGVYYDDLADAVRGLPAPDMDGPARPEYVVTMLTGPRAPEPIGPNYLGVLRQDPERPEGLAAALRRCLRFDRPDPTESVLETLARKAADALDTLQSRRG